MSTSSKLSIGRAALAIFGLGYFVHLILASGVSAGMIAEVGGWALAALFLVSLAVNAMDTAGWARSLASSRRPSLGPLLFLRAAGEALTSSLPGGLVLGEAYKGMILTRWKGVSLSELGASLVLVKFGLAITQSAFVVTGAIISYDLLRTQSSASFGTVGAERWILGATLAVGIGLVLGLVRIARGRALVATWSLLGRLPSTSVRTWIAARADRVEELDRRSAELMRERRGDLLPMLGFLGLGWILMVGESYILLYALGLDPTLGMAFAVESLGSLFRLIFFMVPSGIGGQDASYFALLRLYRVPDASIGLFVLLKRAKELLWIGIGLASMLMLRKREAS
ncbi:MAG: flippase-like domain-containing protein [Deltaproteobacteria bacterium]|nr:flippase-like domain-containing protein [Deltaproteobacteria bacterium]